jgi:hypothetical protein
MPPKPSSPGQGVIHHWGLEVDDRTAFAETIAKHGGGAVKPKPMR